MQPTKVLVRVQAKGGKYIGPDAGYTRVTLRDAESRHVLAQGDADGGSGNLADAYSAGASREVIVTTQPNGDQSLTWLSALPATKPPAAGLTVSLDLAEPRRVEFTAESLTDGKPNGHYVTETMWLAPGADFTAEPGMVLVIPGLIVKLISVVPGNASVAVSAWVTMMCGCKIDPSLPWIPTEFTVTATVRDHEGRVVAQQELDFKTTSTYAATPAIALPGPGRYRLTVDAVQPLEANAGSASFDFQAG